MEQILAGRAAGAAVPADPREFDRLAERMAGVVAYEVARKLGVLDLGQTWLNTGEAAKRSGMSRTTLSRAMQGLDLDGHQGVANGTWRVHVNAVDAWVQGATYKEQREACGCARFDKMRSRKR